MLFAVLAKKVYIQNQQYRASHLIHNIASALFGFIYISIWSGVGLTSSLGDYDSNVIVSYIAFNQAALWVTLFLTNGLGIEALVRNGQISIELIRPVHLFYQLMCREWGQIAYQFVYKFLPIYLLYFVVFSLQHPTRLSTWISTTIALALAAYISICINFLIGIAAIWTIESRWFYWLNHAFSMILSGFFIPIEWLPAWLQTISRASPYPYLQYHPTRIYLELDRVYVLLGSVLWVFGLTGICLLATKLVRRRLEVQGG
jgi:ABC-2 type transport system permease protein